MTHTPGQFDASKHPRAASGEFTTKYIDEADLDQMRLDAQMADDDDASFAGRPEPTAEDLNDAQWKNQPLNIAIQPQFWDGDTARDLGPIKRFDIAPILRRMPYEDRDRLFAALRDEDQDEMERLYDIAAEEGLAPPGLGPFYCYPDVTMGDPEEGETDDLSAWDAANPYDKAAHEAEQDEYHRPKTAYAAAPNVRVEDLKVGDIVVFEEPLAAGGGPKCNEYVVTAAPELVKVGQHLSEYRTTFRQSVGTGAGRDLIVTEPFTPGAGLNVAPRCPEHDGAWGNRPGCGTCTGEDNTPLPLPA